MNDYEYERALGWFLYDVGADAGAGGRCLLLLAGWSLMQTTELDSKMIENILGKARWAVIRFIEVSADSYRLVHILPRGADRKPARYVLTDLGISKIRKDCWVVFDGATEHSEQFKWVGDAINEIFTWPSFQKFAGTKHGYLTYALINREGRAVAHN